MDSDVMTGTNLWDSDKAYGQMLHRRAMRLLPEMECSKALARRVSELWKPGYRVLDVGSGPGHYLVSLRRMVSPDLAYTGFDKTADYVARGKTTFAGDRNTDFLEGDIYALPYADASFEIVICCNVLPFLPTVMRPLRELIRVARVGVIIRLFASDRSYLVREVRGERPEFDDAGEPTAYVNYNIYSESYLNSIATTFPGVRSCVIEPDVEFDPAAFADRDQSQARPTAILAGQQVNGCIILPNAFMTVLRNS